MVWLLVAYSAAPSMAAAWAVVWGAFTAIVPMEVAMVDTEEDMADMVATLDTAGMADMAATEDAGVVPAVELATRATAAADTSDEPPKKNTGSCSQ